MTRLAAFFTVALLSAPAATAATYTFDFTTEGRGWQEDFTVGATGGGATLGVSGGRFTDDSNGRPIYTSDARVATWVGAGLGVCNKYDDEGRQQGCEDEQHEIDGLGYNDLAIFDVIGDGVYELVSVAFGYVDSNDDFDFFLNIAGDGIGLLRDMADVDIPGSGLYTFAPGTLVTSTFGIGADGGSCDRNGRNCVGDNFKIREITLREVAPIPLPAAGFLLLGALGALGVAARRRKA